MIKTRKRTRAISELVNWGEFFDIVKRRVGPAKTTDALHILEQLPIELYPIDQPLVRAAAEIKVTTRLSTRMLFASPPPSVSTPRFNNDPEFESVKSRIKIPG